MLCQEGTANGSGQDQLKVAAKVLHILHTNLMITIEQAPQEAVRALQAGGHAVLLIPSEPPSLGED